MIERAIAERASAQLGLLTRTQARAAGHVPCHDPPARLDSGELRLVGSQVLWPAGLPPSPRLRGDGRLPRRGWGGFAPHCGVGLHGPRTDAAARPPIEVMVVKGRTATTTPLARVHTTTNLPPDDVLVVEGVPTTSVARTLLGVAPSSPTRSGADDAGGGGRGRGPRAPGVGPVAVVAARGATLPGPQRCVGSWSRSWPSGPHLGPTESWLERETLRILGEAGLPLPEVQKVIRRKGRLRLAGRLRLPGPAGGRRGRGQGPRRDATEGASMRTSATRSQLLGHTILTFTYGAGRPDPRRGGRGRCAEALARRTRAPRAAGGPEGDRRRLVLSAGRAGNSADSPRTVGRAGSR